MWNHRVFFKWTRIKLCIMPEQNQNRWVYEMFSDLSSSMSSLDCLLHMLNMKAKKLSKRMNTDTFAGFSIAIVAFHTLTVEVSSSTIKWALGFWSTVHSHTVQSICKIIHILSKWDVSKHLHCSWYLQRYNSSTKMSVVWDSYFHILIVYSLS